MSKYEAVITCGIVSLQLKGGFNSKRDADVWVAENLELIGKIVFVTSGNNYEICTREWTPKPDANQIGWNGRT